MRMSQLAAGDAQTVRASTKKRKAPVEKTGHADAKLWRNSAHRIDALVFLFFVIPA